MIWSTKALKDTTIYESDRYLNTGLDQILEIGKYGQSTTGDLAESRALIKFDLDQLPSILNSADITINDISASLRLYPVQESELPFLFYTIEAKSLSHDWGNGVGIYYKGTTPESNNIVGATWVNTDGSGSTTWGNALTTGSMMNYNTIEGGGVWYTSSIASQSFKFGTTDLVDINVTDIVKRWYNNTLSNNGFLVSLKHNEITGSHTPNTVMQFYSAETHTVFEPQLYISWTGSLTYTTGSLSPIQYEDYPVIYTRNFKAEHTQNTKVRVMIAARPKYPRPNFSQNSAFSNIKYLPKSTYYQILDAHNDNIIVPYSESTKLNTNTSGSYFDFYTTMMYPERYYKFQIKSVINGVEEYFTSNDFIFKVIK
jgi:hypothetical protein